MLDRRRFLRHGLTLLSLGTTAPGFLVNSLGQQSRMAQEGMASSRWTAAAAAKRVLVVVQLSGGNDGLNTVVPYGDPVYYNSRPVLGIREDQVLKLNNSLGVPIGLHPRMAKLLDLYNEGKVSLIQGVGYPNPNRSHFRAMDIWHTAEPAVAIKQGWLGRYFDHELSECPTCLKGINVGGSLPLAMQTKNTASPSISNINTYRLQEDARYPGDANNRLKVFQEIMSAEARNDDLEYIQQTALDAHLSSVELLAGVNKYPTAGAPTYPNGSFGAGLRLIAQVIAGEVGVRVFYVSIGGFDTHATQVVTSANTTGSHANLLGQVADGLEAFWRDISRPDVNKGQEIVIMTFSEFGRRIKENGSAGTDHGTSLPMFLLGNGVKAGAFNPHPSLETNLNQGDLGFTVDFRSVYATVLEGWLGADSTAILGKTWSQLQVL